MANESQESDSLAFSETPPRSTNLTSRGGLIQRLRGRLEARARFVDSHLSKKLAFQIRSLRGDLTQEQMQKKLGMNQQAISRLENPYYGKATLTTLKRIAAAFDVGLVVEFVPFSQLVNRVSGTPYVEYGLGPETMNVRSFEEEEKAGAFENIEESQTEHIQHPIVATVIGSGGYTGLAQPISTIEYATEFRVVSSGEPIEGDNLVKGMQNVVSLVAANADVDSYEGTRMIYGAIPNA